MYKLRFTPMKWLFSLIVVLGMFSVPNLYAEEPSFTLYNAGFEEPLVDGKIPGWTQTYGTGGFTVTDEMAYEGEHSLKLVDPDDAQSYGVVSDKISMTAGDLYTVSAKVYTEQTAPSLYLYFYDASGRQIQQNSKIYRLDQLATHEWVTISLEGSAPPEATHLNVLLYTSTRE